MLAKYAAEAMERCQKPLARPVDLQIALAQKLNELCLSNPYWNHLSPDAKQEFIWDAQTILRFIEQHSKPKWSDAPEWAQCLTQDESMAWRWHEHKPRAFHGTYHWVTVTGRWAWASPSNPHWMDTLEGNPATAASISTLEPRPENEDG